MHTKSCIFLSSGNFMPLILRAIGQQQTPLQGPAKCSGSGGIIQENEHPESWWSCWQPPWCPLHSSPQAILSTLLTKEPDSQVKAECSSLLLLGELKASPPTFAPGRLPDLAGGHWEICAPAGGCSGGSGPWAGASQLCLCSPAILSLLHSIPGMEGSPTCC